MKILKIIGGIILLLLVVFLAAGFVVPKVTYETSVTVNKPISETFALFNDMEHLQKWIPEVKSIETMKETPNKIGSQYKMKVVSEGSEVEMVETVIDYKDNELVSLDFDAGDMHKVDTYHFSSDGDMTNITANHVCTGNSYIMKCMFAFFKGMFKGIDQGYQNNFKAYAEGHN